MRHLSLVLLVFVSLRVAAAQPAPAPMPAPAPGDPAAPPAPPADTGPVTTPDQTTPVAPVEPAPPPTDDKPGVTAKYDGGLKLATDDDQYELKLMFRTQLRFESNRPLDEFTPTGASSQFTNRFYIPRSRLSAEGHVFGKANRYKLELGLGDAGSFSFVKDLFIEKKLSDGPVWLRMGQWKRPFNRAEIVGDFTSTFNERSIQNDLAGGGRDMGIAVHNDYEKSPEGLEWVAGVFNGFSGGADRPAQTTSCSTNAMTGALTCTTTRPSNFPTDFGPALVARGAWNSAKLKGYNEGDIDGGDLRYGVGVAYKIDLANFAPQGEVTWADNMQHGVELDTMVKVSGFGLHAGVVMMMLKQSVAPDPLYGVYVQPSMMVIAKLAEVAARFAYTTGDAADPDRGTVEARAAFNYFFKGHTFKVASDAGFVMKTGENAMMETDKPDLQIRVMLQLSL